MILPKGAESQGLCKFFFDFSNIYAKIALELSWLVSFSNAHSSSVLTHSVYNNQNSFFTFSTKQAPCLRMVFNSQEILCTTSSN
jgi:hypothetical protein